MSNIKILSMFLVVTFSIVASEKMTLRSSSLSSKKSPSHVNVLLENSRYDDVRKGNKANIPQATLALINAICDEMLKQTGDKELTLKTRQQMRQQTPEYKAYRAVYERKYRVDGHRKKSDKKWNIIHGILKSEQSNVSITTEDYELDTVFAHPDNFFVVKEQEK